MVTDIYKDTGDQFRQIDMRLVPGFNPTTALVHAVVLSQDDQGGGAEISYQAVADEVGISIRTAQRTIQKLRDGGLLKPEIQGGRMANRYQPAHRSGWSK
jgi:hypothetical protein